MCSSVWPTLSTSSSPLSFSSLKSSSSSASSSSELASSFPSISMSTTSTIQNEGRFSSYSHTLFFALLNTASTYIFSLRKLIDGFVVSRLTPSLANCFVHFSISVGLPQTAKIVSKDHLFCLDRNLGLVFDLARLSSSGITRCFSKNLMTLSRTPFILWQASRLSL